MSWIGYGLRRGILTTRYPLRPDAMPPSYRGEVEALLAGIEAQRIGADACLSGAIRPAEARAGIDRQRCFQCGECARRAPEAFRLTSEFALAEVAGEPEETRTLLRRRMESLGRSVHLRHIDVGSDGSEEQELQAIFNPFYDVNRLGIFLTATPRHADILIVSGVVTDPMVEPLRRTYEAMPEPRLVIALGTAACSGSIFYNGPTVVGPCSKVLPVDVGIPGAPPSPLTILHGLWVALGRLDGRPAAA